MSEAALQAYVDALKKQLPRINGKTTVTYRLIDQEESTYWAWASFAEGRNTSVSIFGFTAEQLEVLLDLTKEHWLSGTGSGERIYTITIRESVPTIIRYMPRWGHRVSDISFTCTELRYENGWLYESATWKPEYTFVGGNLESNSFDTSEYRYKFTENTNKMHIERWYASRWHPHKVATHIPITSPDGTSESSGVVCDRFVLDSRVDDSTLHLSVDTDLPDHTVIMVTVSRSYVERDDPMNTRYSIKYFAEKSTVGKWRSPLPISLADERWHSELESFQKKMEPLGLEFTVGSVSKHIDVSIVVPINQPDLLFGSKNSNLKGTAVTKSGQLNIVRAESRIDRPLATSP